MGTRNRHALSLRSIVVSKPCVATRARTGTHTADQSTRHPIKQRSASFRGKRAHCPQARHRQEQQRTTQPGFENVKNKKDGEITSCERKKERRKCERDAAGHARTNPGNNTHTEETQQHSNAATTGGGEVGKRQEGFTR